MRFSSLSPGVFSTYIHISDIFLFFTFTDRRGILIVWMALGGVLDTCLLVGLLFSLDFMTAMTTSAHVCDVFHGQCNKVSLLFFLFRLPKNRGNVTLSLPFISFRTFSFLSLSAHCSGWGVSLFFSFSFLFFLETISRQFQFSRRIAFCFPPPLLPTRSD